MKTAGILKSLFVLGILGFHLYSASQSVVAAQQPVTKPALSAACGGENRTLLGVVPSWDRGLGSCENLELEEFLEGNKVKLLINNIIAIIVSLAGIVAVAFVIVGGFTYIVSSGNPEQATNARKTIINALVGLVIVVFGRLVTEVVYNQLTTM